VRSFQTSPDRAAGTDAAPACPAERRASVVRWFLAALGLVSMGLGIVGIWVPGLPTTIFLIVASWLFTRSCPALDRWMRSLGPVKPFVRFLDGAPIPGSLVPWILALIWAGGIWGAVAARHLIWSPVILTAVVVGSVVVLSRSAWFARGATDEV
jgi:uncharacterized membrane protein YbaN (DUF454 family)